LNTEIARAHTISRMTETEEKILEMLSTISEDDVQRLGLLLSISDDKELNLGNNEESPENNFLHDYVYHELKLNNSVPYKHGGIRSEQLIRIVEQKIIPDSSGLFNSIKSRFGGR